MSCNDDNGGGRVTDNGLFQSLSGFLMSCNITVSQKVAVGLNTVSIPIGFSNEL